MFSLSNKRGVLAALALTGYPLLVRGERYQNAAESQVNVTFLKEAITGIPPELQGDPQSVQGFLYEPGLQDAVINETAVDNFLVQQLPEGVRPTQLVVPSWAADPVIPLDATDPVTNGTVINGEAMLDVETLRLAAPKATTLWYPSHYATDYVVAKLRDAGYSDSEVEELGPQITNLLASAQVDGPKDNNTAPGLWFTALDDFDPDVQAAIQKAMTSWFREFIGNITTNDPVPDIISNSYGSAYQHAGVPFEVIEDEFKKLTLEHGITLIGSSGDGGAGSGNKMLDGTQCLPASDPLISNNPSQSWPKRSPWFTIVGGTMLDQTGDVITQHVSNTMEGAVITSGGGFASQLPGAPEGLYARPAWQEEAVSRYLAENNPTTFAAFPTEDTPGFNPNGRAYPDIAFYSDAVPFVNGSGTFEIVGGTSFSAPAVAAVFTLVNEQLQKDGYGKLGYANPMIYWMGENCTEAFTDVTVGDNLGTHNPPHENCLFGYPAAPGWDATTGFGAINFEPFIACAKRYQDEVRSKGLELLPDGSRRSVASLPSSALPSGSPSGSMSDSPSGSMSDSPSGSMSDSPSDSPSGPASAATLSANRAMVVYAALYAPIVALLG
jgi:hypothetical protein